MLTVNKTSAIVRECVDGTLNDDVEIESELVSLSSWLLNYKEERKRKEVHFDLFLNVPLNCGLSLINVSERLHQNISMQKCHM